MKEEKNQLNKEQTEAVNHKEGPLLIVAGAGTGKTKVITERIANIIKENWANSDEILALTFTEKAAGEMEERVDNLLPLGYFDLWISTFHSFGEKILRESGLEIGVPADFKLFNEFEQYSLFKKNLDKFDLDYYRPLGNPTKFIRSLLKHFSRLKDEDISPEEYLNYTEELKQNLDNCLSGGLGAKKALDIFKSAEGEFDKEVASMEVMRLNEVANAYHVYQNLLLEESALDFGDLINYCLKLFRERPNVLEKYKQKFKYILLDEFQDTNWAQYELIKILASPKNNLVVVADDDQAIFRFRGASMSNILQFKKDYSNTKEIVLVENYRNSQNILDLSYNFITLNNPNRLEFQLAEGNSKLDKKLKANTKEDGEIGVIEAVDSSSEIAQVVNKIAELKTGDKEATWNDFAILTRTNEQAKEATSFLDEARFPYTLYSSRGLYLKDPVMNVISYLRSVTDFYNNNAMFKILSLPIFGFTIQNLVNLNYLAQKKAWSIYQVLKNASLLQINIKETEKINKFLTIFEKHVALARDKNVSEVVLAFVNDTGYLKHLIKDEEAKAREATNFLQQFMKRVKAFEQDTENKTTKAFLEELNVEIEAGELGSLPMNIDAGPETIKIMTVHSAKGLEFKYVFITNMVDKRFPTIEKREMIKIPDQLVKEILPDGDYHLEEERRLFYVAITRAKRGIYFSFARDCGGKRKKRASRFLIETKLVDDLSQDDDKCKKEENKVDLLKKKKERSMEPADKIAPPKTFSYTQLAAFENCPYQYRFAHILKIPLRGKPSFSFGKTMHSALQKIFNSVMQKAGLNQNDLFGQSKKTKKEGGSDKITLDECLKIYKESWIDDWYPNEKLKEEYRKKGKEIIKNFYELHKNNWPETILLEKGFSTKINVDGENFSVRGQIDRIDKKDDKLKIIDYKTGNPKEKLLFKDKEQLLLYQLACLGLFREEISGLAFYYLNNNSEVEFLGNKNDLEKMREKITENIRSIKKGEFPPKPSELCKYCDFASICEHRKA